MTKTEAKLESDVTDGSLQKAGQESMRYFKSRDSNTKLYVDMQRTCTIITK